MKWEVFTYIQPQQGEEKPAFSVWLAYLANAIHAEYVQVLNDTEVLMRYPIEYSGNHDSHGNPL